MLAATAISVPQVVIRSPADTPTLDNCSGGLCLICTLVERFSQNVLLANHIFWSTALVIVRLGALLPVSVLVPFLVLPFGFQIGLHTLPGNDRAEKKHNIHYAHKYSWTHLENSCETRNKSNYPTCLFLYDGLFNSGWEGDLVFKTQWFKLLARCNKSKKKKEDAPSITMVTSLGKTGIRWTCHQVKSSSTSPPWFSFSHRHSHTIGLVHLLPLRPQCFPIQEILQLPWR